MGKRSVEITVTPRQRVILKRVTRSKKAEQQLVERCRVVLLSATGLYSAGGMSWALIASVFVAGDIAGRAR